MTHLKALLVAILISALMGTLVWVFSPKEHKALGTVMCICLGFPGCVNLARLLLKLEWNFSLFCWYKYFVEVILTVPCGTAWSGRSPVTRENQMGSLPIQGAKRVTYLSTFAGRNKQECWGMLLFYFGGIDAKVSDTDCKSVSFGTRCFEYIYLHHSWVAQQQSGTLLKPWLWDRSPPVSLCMRVWWNIGKHGRLKICCRKACGFKPHHAH